MIRTLLREPLVHFAALGGALFVLYRVLSPAAIDGSQIVVSSDRISAVAAQFEGVRQRPPSREELAGLIDAYVHDEVMYREGLALGLDRDDPIVRNRVKLKMELLSEASQSAEPTPAELQKYLDEHREAFAIPASLSFEQLYFDPDRRGDELEHDVRAALAALRANPDAQVLGDTTQLPAGLTRVVPADVSAAFGPEFAKAVDKLPIDVWSGPVRSSFGEHLVRVTWRTEPAVPTLADAHDVVLREWTHARDLAAKESLYRTLRARYSVTIDHPNPIVGGPGGAQP